MLPQEDGDGLNAIYMGGALPHQGGSGGGGREKVTVANGNHALSGQSHRDGVTSDGAENAPRLRVTYGEDSQESVPPLKHRVKTHTASAQGSSTPVPWRWRSRGARIRSHIDRGVADRRRKARGC